MTSLELEAIAREFKLLLPRVIPRKKRDGRVTFALKFHGIAGRSEVEIDQDATAEAAKAKISAAVVG